MWGAGCEGTRVLDLWVGEKWGLLDLKEQEKCGVLDLKIQENVGCWI